MHQPKFISGLRSSLVVALLTSLVLSLLIVRVGRASTTIVVNSTTDAINTDGACTLREAIIAANKDKASNNTPGECPAGSGADTIILPAGTYLLTRSDNGREDASATGDLDITQSLTISGSGNVVITTNSGFTDRIFHVLAGSVTLSGVTIRNGNTSRDGGGLYNKTTLTLSNSTLSGNRAGNQGGGIFNAGALTLTNVTLSGNTSKASGGGLYNSSSTATLTNVTFASNTADSDANGTGDGGGIFRSSGTVNLKNTLIGTNSDNSPGTKHPDCSGTLASQGFNLIHNATGCTLTGTTTGNLTGLDPNLGPLQNNGGSTFTHALLVGSPAIEAGTNTGCPATDQRGIIRPQGLTCDIGAFEFENPPQPGPSFTVNSTDDPDDGLCTFNHCSFREAIDATNARPNGASPDRIQFNIAGTAPHIIQPTSGLPTITDAVILDATNAGVELDGLNAGAADGLTINASNSTVRGLVIHGFSGSGVRVNSGVGNSVQGNSIFDNGQLGIDLGGDGPTANDTGDPDAGANNRQNFPVLMRAIPVGDSTTVEGRFNGAANTTFTLEFFANAACDPSGSGEGQTFLGSASVTTDSTGDANFQVALNSVVPSGQFVTATATDPAGNTSEFSQCTTAGPANDSWINALPLSPSDIPASVDQPIDRQGQSRWYKFSIQPNSKVIVTLTNLPSNYDLTLYKDISVTLQSLNSQALDSAQDLERLGAEFAPDAFSPDAFSPDAFSPDAFSPDAFSPDAFSPDAFSPDAFSPDAFSPDAFSPDAFSPDAFSPDAFSPDAFSPDAFSPDAFSPDAFSPDAFSPDAFSGAQTRSLIAISAFEGTAGEGVLVNTWENTGEFYVRVRGRNGAFRLGAPFHLQVILLTGSCDSVNPSLPAPSLTATAGNYKTIIVTDPGRMGSTSALADKLAALAARLEVAGVVVDVGADARVVAANQQATDHPGCPFAKNLVAQSIKDIVDAYRTLNPLEYVVIVGNDDVIPFFRHPDQALLASEKNYVPPVRDNTASQASLKLGYVLSQDRYGAGLDISLKTNMLPLPGLAVGRLVETEADATRLLDAYLGTADGVVSPPTSALVTGYDFLEDAALAVQAELEAGIGTPADTLIADRNLSPLDPAAWTADDLRAQLLGSRHDLIFLAGHFSANSALAADYRTRLSATEVASSAVDLENAIIFSAGCHSGYNIVNPHGIPGVTVEPDWAQAFAQKGATLIAGTGYQYGDTDFVEYSERLYLEFSRQLRAGTGPVAVGKALAAAKQAYLAGTPQMRAIHEKAYLEATLFGLPMLSVDLPAGRGGTTGDTSIVSETNNVSTNPGAALGLSFADVMVTPSLTEHNVVLSSTAGSTVTAMYLSGSNGVVANPAEPVLPLEVRNVSVPGTALRGVGFRSGNFSDAPNVLPLLGAATTEIRGVHTPFLSDVFYPIRPWSVNYFDALAGGSDGATYLMLLPAQVQSSTPGSSTAVLRRFSDMGFRLYYSDNATTYAGNSTPALAAPPAIVRVSATPGAGDVTFSVTVVGNPAAGIQEVWVTYSAVSGPLAGRWQSLDLAQSATDSTLWQGTLPLGETISEDIRYIVQAANGVGLVSLNTNQGEFYTPGIEVEPTQPTALTFQTPPASGPYGSRATFSAILTNNGTPLANQRVVFRLGSQGRQAFTDSAGSASAILPLLGLPDQYQVRVSFAGTDTYIASSAESPFTITKQGTLLSLAPASATGHLGEDGLMVATLKDAAGRPLSEKTVFFVVSGTGGSYSVVVITDFAGRATLDRVPLPVGSYTVNAYFSGIIPLPAGTLSLDDERYQPATTTGSLTLITFPPVAEPDAYSLDGGETLTVEAPGVLGNDNDADGDSLTALLVEGPAHGTLSLNPDGSFSYTPDLNFSGSDSFTYKARDIHDAESNVVAVTLTVNPVNVAPNCSSATASVDALWPPDKEFKPVTVIGVTDPDGDPILITISGIRQDEPVGNRPDGQGVGTSIAEVRADRDGNGNGRVYHIFFSGADGRGGTCSGHVRVPVVPHDQSGDIDAIDGGPLYDSTVVP